ncbi:hypothetical protein OH76DRAFT_1405834 [Lentinus brumalis]|uniref:Uncharacterized protein n=1 Tax=Lentinus brumalis TaxID=2498619 RepID=A0A371D4N7_9APHY|nr:hypothetical protein OH76DRAFT_1405834 [Polyporus brumalis]
MSRKRPMNHADTRRPAEGKRRRSGEFHPQGAVPSPSSQNTPPRIRAQESAHDRTPHTYHHHPDDLVIPEIRLSVPDGSEQVLHRPAVPQGYTLGSSADFPSHPRQFTPHALYAPTHTLHHTLPTTQPSPPRQSWPTRDPAAFHSASSSPRPVSRTISTPQHARTSTYAADVDMEPNPTRCTRQPECMCSRCYALRIHSSADTGSASDSNVASMMDDFSRLVVRPCQYDPELERRGVRTGGVNAPNGGSGWQGRLG